MARDEEKFQQFMRQVDLEIRKATGGTLFSHLDFADWDYASAFESEMTPRETAEEALADDGFPVEEWS